MGLKKTIRKFLGVSQLEESIVAHTLNQEKELLFRQRELKAIEILKPYLPTGYLFETGFSLPFQLIQHIINDMLVYRPATLLEFGSGLSTQILSKMIHVEGLDIQLISVDNDADWQQILRKDCPQVQFYSFPLLPESPYAYTNSGSWYDIPSKAPWGEKPIDMVLVDGPKGSTCEKARYGFIPFLEGKLGERPILYVDDTHREEERFILEQASSFFNLPQVQSFHRYSRLSHTENFYTAPS
ncbi:hypothetical protein [Algoriphagus sp. NG3]|uniref:hypothetical protein n=1 Tax=Algoriphagus sp. NG3 TaxID=3097546 RepID=UPI002A825BBD|nr:hypothetical protein [Algoriphagus sp. NG3]WPR76873.1 hypothetical protein SLW71_05910 [Algoriphagus sp. NG3]